MYHVSSTPRKIVNLCLHPACLPKYIPGMKAELVEAGQMQLELIEAQLSSEESVSMLHTGESTRFQFDALEQEVKYRLLDSALPYFYRMLICCYVIML